MLSSSNRCNCQKGSGIPTGSNWAIMDAGMTERCRMPMTWVIDRPRAFVGRDLYPSYLSKINSPNELGKHMHTNVYRCFQWLGCKVEAPEAMMPYGILCCLPLHLCIIIPLGRESRSGFGIFINPR